MMWLKLAVFVLLAVMVVVFLLALTKPAIFRVQRSTRIKAPAEKIFPFINDFRGWAAWSPYTKLDPAMKQTFSGAQSGQGAVYEWDGSGKAGAGRMEIVESLPASKIGIDLHFLKPFEAHNKAEFTMTPQGDETEVTWAMFGPALFISKVMQVFCNLDKLVGRDFEVGLENLKTASER